MTNSVRVDKLGACLVSMLQVCQLKMIYGLDIGVEGVIIQGALEEVWPYDPPASGPGLFSSLSSARRKSICWDGGEMSVCLH